MLWKQTNKEKASCISKLNVCFVERKSPLNSACAAGGACGSPDGKVFLFGPLRHSTLCFHSSASQPFFICINFGEYSHFPAPRLGSHAVLSLHVLLWPVWRRKIMFSFFFSAWECCHHGRRRRANFNLALASLQSRLRLCFVVVMVFFMTARQVVVFYGRLGAGEVNFLACVSRGWTVIKRG